MSCAVGIGEDGLEEVLFLYKLAAGACPKSYGVNVAPLAGKIYSKLVVEFTCMYTRKLWTAFCWKTDQVFVSDFFRNARIGPPSSHRESRRA
jgi:hypothetical protein